MISIRNVLRTGALFPLTVVSAVAQNATSSPVRARDLGVPFEGTSGALNAITDFTASGRKALKAQSADWDRLSAAVSQVLRINEAQ